jgi:hypothetical protein
MPTVTRNKMPASSIAARNITDATQRESHQFQDILVGVWTVAVLFGCVCSDLVSGFVVIVVTP